MAYGGTAVTPGTGASIRGYTDANTQIVQVVRDHRATAESDLFWTVTTGGTASAVAADPTRVGVLLTSFASGRVYLRFDATIPTSTATAHSFIDPGERFLIPSHLVELAISMAGSVAGGTVSAHLGTAA